MSWLVKRLAACAALIGLSGAASAATTINVDFNSIGGLYGTFSGAAAAPDSGTTWNGVLIGPEAGSPLIPAVTSGPLVTSTGLATPVLVALGNFRVYEADERPSTVGTALLTDFAYQQNLGPGGPNSTFSISNLNPGLTYDLYLYAQNGNYANTATLFTINGISQTAVNGGDLGNFVQDANYVVFQGLAPDASGAIFGTFNDAAAANNAAFNGLQIVQVPEPGCVALLAPAGLLLLRRRRA